jgi:hypothetical protein
VTPGSAPEPHRHLVKKEFGEIGKNRFAALLRESRPRRTVPARPDDTRKRDGCEAGKKKAGGSCLWLKRPCFGKAPGLSAGRALGLKGTQNAQRKPAFTCHLVSTSPPALFSTSA